MTIDFYINFTKRINSTKRPAEGGIVTKHTLTGHLKEPCSVMNPVIDIQDNPVQNAPCVMTYAYIPAFYRYYFVKDWVWNNGLWTVHLAVDVLASYRPHIGETTAYIERCAYDFNTYVMDKLYPTTLEPVVQDILINAPWVNVNPSSGCYVVGIVSGSSSTVTGSAVTYYAMTIQQLAHLINYLLSDQYIDDSGFTAVNTQGVSHDVAKSLLNPLQYIVSCMWIPRTAQSIGESSPRQIKVGYYSIATTIAEGYWISDTTVVMFAEHTVLSHPDAGTRGKYLNYSPYTLATCFLPPFGQFPIDLQYFEDTDSIEFVVNLDVVTGKADLRVRKKNEDDQTWVIYSTSAMMGVPIQLAQVANDLIKATTSAISIAGNAVGSFAQAMSLHGIGATHSGLMSLQSIGNAIEALMPRMISEGVNGSFVSFRQSAFITYKFNMQVDEDNTEQGRPLCELRRIDTLPGYIKCGEATVDYYAFDSELEQIHRYLLSGFFWE